MDADSGKRRILDGTVVRVRLDGGATSISLPVALGVRRDGQNALLTVRAMGGEGDAAWRGVLDDIVARGWEAPEFLVVDGAARPKRALAALWPAVPAQRRTARKHRNLLAHGPKALREALSADHTGMIYAATAKEIGRRRRAFLRQWRLKCRAAADGLEEAGDRLFAYARLPPSQSKSARTTNAAERLHEGAKRGFAQATDQDPDRAAVGRDRADAVLGHARIGADH